MIVTHVSNRSNAEKLWEGNLNIEEVLSYILQLLEKVRYLPPWKYFYIFSA